jgi:dienelactone hydrolase
MATYGYQVIVPDALHHGERNPIDHDAPKMLETYLWKIILQNVKESGIIIDSIIEKHDADPHRIGIMGSSMGGFSGAGVFIHNPNLKCFVNFNGSCAWLCTEEIFRQRTQRPFMEESFVADLSQFDPMCNKDKLKERPILMLHGDADSSVPISCQRMFYSEVAPLYKDDPERLKLEEIPRMDHYISTGMLEEGIMWLKKYL